MKLYQDREDAARQMIADLPPELGPDWLVLALPRGGVPIGAVLARHLGAPLDVLAISQSLQLQVGQDRVLADPDALECAKLPQGGRYLAVVHSAATLDAAPFRYRMTGLRGGSAVPVSGWILTSFTLAGDRAFITKSSG